MTLEEKALALYKRHVKVVIEWCGTDVFTNCSDMSLFGVMRLMRLIKHAKSNQEFNKSLTEIIQEEHEQEN